MKPCWPLYLIVGVLVCILVVSCCGCLQGSTATTEYGYDFPPIVEPATQVGGKQTAPAPACQKATPRVKKSASSFGLIAGPGFNANEAVRSDKGLNIDAAGNLTDEGRKVTWWDKFTYWFPWALTGVGVFLAGYLAYRIIGRAKAFGMVSSALTAVTGQLPKAKEVLKAKLGTAGASYVDKFRVDR
jgi:hypothetical protein